MLVWETEPSLRVDEARTAFAFGSRLIDERDLRDQTSSVWSMNPANPSTPES